MEILWKKSPGQSCHEKSPGFSAGALFLPGRTSTRLSSRQIDKAWAVNHVPAHVAKSSRSRRRQDCASRNEAPAENAIVGSIDKLVRSRLSTHTKSLVEAALGGLVGSAGGVEQLVDRVIFDGGELVRVKKRDGGVLRPVKVGGSPVMFR